MKLPDGTHLGYTVSTEAWYSATERQPEIFISASADDPGGGAWGFSVEEHDLAEHGLAIRVAVFEDGFAAFTQIPEFFAALADEEISRLAEVRELLDRLGAVDETQREPDYAPTPGLAAFTQYYRNAGQHPPSWAGQPAAVRAGWEAIARAAVHAMEGVQ